MANDCRLLTIRLLTVKDVGCGKGEPMAFINRHSRFKVVGIDIFKPYVEEAGERSHVLRSKSNNNLEYRTSNVKLFSYFFPRIACHMVTEKGKLTKHRTKRRRTQ